MADRAGERTKTHDVDELLAEVDNGAVDPDESQDRAARGTDQRDPTLRERIEELFSPRVFLVALVLTTVGVALGRFVPIPFIGGLLGFVGVFLAGFALGIVSDGRHYPETGVAGALVTGGWSVLGNFTLVLVGVGLPFILANAGIGLVCGLLGHYFGRDLRNGLTREV